MSGQGDRKEVKSIPGPPKKCDLVCVRIHSNDVVLKRWISYRKEKPLLTIEQGEGFEGIWGLSHRRHQSGNTCEYVATNTHVLLNIW